jgi:uncharacterized protein (TIGR02118 family)
VTPLFRCVGLTRYEVDRAAVNDAPFIAACHLYVNDAEDFRKAIAKHGTELLGDIPNYTAIQAQMQISEIVV